MIVGFGDYRRELERIAPPRTLFTGPLEHRHLVHLIPLADVVVVPSIFPEAFGMVAAEAAAAGCPPLVARHSGLAEVAEGLEAAYPPELPAPGELRDRRLARPRRQAPRAARAAAPDARRELGDAARRRRGRALVVGGRRRAAARSPSSSLLTSMGEAQKLPYDELLRRSRDDFDAGTDFTVAVEEEFALLDPETLALVNRFEELKAAAAGTAVEEHLVGELIASRGRGAHGALRDVRRGRRARWASAAAQLCRARRAARASSLGATGTHPWSRWQDQRIIDTPHYRRNDELLRYVVWRNNTFGLHVHVGIRGADRAIAVHDGLRAVPPAPARALGELAVRRGRQQRAPLGAHARSSRACSRAAASRTPTATGPGCEAYVRLLYETGSIDEHTQIWWSVRPHLAYPTVEIRICDAQPDLAEARALAALAYALAARIARAVDEGEPLPDPPPRMIEENMWRAIRYGLSGELLDPGTYEVRPARAELERLVEWVAPVADELGVPLSIPAANAAERQIARVEEGWSLEEIYAEQVARARSSVAEQEPSGGGAARAAPGRVAEAQGLGRPRPDRLHRLLARLPEPRRGGTRPRPGAARDRGAAGARAGAEGTVPDDVHARLRAAGREHAARVREGRRRVASSVRLPQAL